MRFEMQAINQAGGAAVLSLIEIEMNSVELTQCKTVCVKAVCTSMSPHGMVTI